MLGDLSGSETVLITVGASAVTGFVALFGSWLNGKQETARLDQQLAHERQQQAEASLALGEREVERRVTQNAATLEAKRAEIENWKTGALAKLREATELADRNYRLGAVPLTTYVEIQKQYLEAISAFNDAQKDALEAAQTLEILTGRKLYREEQQR